MYDVYDNNIYNNIHHHVLRDLSTTLALTLVTFSHEQLTMMARRLILSLSFTLMLAPYQGVEGSRFQVEPVADLLNYRHRQLQHKIFRNYDVSGIKTRGGATSGRKLLDILQTYWYLGLVSFGGPPAHIAILKDIVTVQKGWMTEEIFMEMFSVAQALPGPSSTQLLIATAASHAGILGAMLALFMWCLPGFIVLSLAGMAVYRQDETPLFLEGIPPAAVALTLKAAGGFVSSLNSLQKSLATISCMVAMLIDSDLRIPKTSAQWMYPLMLTIGGLTTFRDSRESPPEKAAKKKKQKKNAKSKELVSRPIFHLPLWSGYVAFLLWAWLFIIATFVDIDNDLFEIWATHYRVGSIIFGGGPVAVPLLAAEILTMDISESRFFQGVGIAQSLPGPFFNFAAYLGAIQEDWKGAIAGQVGLFAPGFILMFALMPFWSKLREHPSFRSSLRGINATAIGLLVSACITIYTSSIKKGADAMILVGSGSLVAFSTIPSPVVIGIGSALGAMLSKMSLGQKPYL
jgi:chromate transporter